MSLSTAERMMDIDIYRRNSFIIGAVYEKIKQDILCCDDYRNALLDDYIYNRTN